MSTPNETPKNINIDFDELDVQEVEAYLQEGSRGIPEYAASCNTIIKDADTTIINNSCGGKTLDEVLSDF
ncbi:MAG: hypothetical protein AAF752_03250 [Bacteroidota bacterium]